VIFAQLLDHDLGCASYLVGDEKAGEAVVVDPPYAIERVLAEAERHGVRLQRVLETHTHADHLSGHGRLALELGLPVSIHPDAAVSFASDALEDGAEVAVGDVVLRCIHTPGHRPEHVALAVTDRSRGSEPSLVLTGDSLFVGDVARPDLAVDARDGAEGLFHSLRRLLELPDAIEMYPGHVAGSLCGRSMSPEPSSTIGLERRSNPMLLLDDLNAFVNESASIASPKPPNLNRIVDLNRGPFVGAPPPLEELPSAADGSQLLDVRSAEHFLAGHLHGAVNVPVSGTSFATRAGFVLDAERPVTILAAAEDEARRAARGLNAVAFLDLAGFVLGAGEEHIEPVSVEELEGLLADGATLIDVREKHERDDGYIAGSRNIPYRLLGLCTDLPGDRPVVTICESGARATVAASILAARGIDARPVLEGGLASWRASGRPVVEFRRCGSA
jgi:glyoxylase-like metal-dependent hydrolase (beta-lactamase superfamily II)/rhodanese-related sulfurtransferase